MAGASDPFYVAKDEVQSLGCKLEAKIVKVIVFLIVILTRSARFMNSKCNIEGSGRAPNFRKMETSSARIIENGPL